MKTALVIVAGVIISVLLFVDGFTATGSKCKLIENQYGYEYRTCERDRGLITWVRGYR